MVHAWIRAEGRPKIACLVRDLSQKGAFLTMEPPSWLPFQFELMVAGEPMPRICELRHVRRDGIGVIFVPQQVVTVAEIFRPKSKEEVEAWLGPTKRKIFKSK